MILLQGCAGQIPSSRTVCDSCRIACEECEGPDRFVRLEQSPLPFTTDRLPTFSHPVKLSPENWKIILSSIRIERQREPILFFLLPKGPTSTVFSQDEVDYLSRTLSQAFAQARPTEWVVFGLSRLREPEVSELTSGGWYLEGSHLYLVLANYRYAVTAPRLRERVWANPLSRQVNLYEVAPGDHQAVVQVQEGRILKAPVTALSIAYQPLLSGDPVSDPGLPNSSPRSSSPQPPSEQRSIQDRLKTLNELRDQGMITDDEYQEKRRRLLDQL